MMTVFGLDGVAWDLCKLSWVAICAGAVSGLVVGYVCGRLFRR